MNKYYYKHLWAMSQKKDGFLNWTPFSSQETKRPLSVNIRWEVFCMASKGQKFKSYSADLKQTILKEYFDGIGTPKTLSLKYDVPYRTIKN